MYYDIILSGFGGQGIMMMGRLLAQAGMMDNNYVTWFPSYGAEMRGGTANCTVVVSSEEITSPIIDQPQAIIIMNNPSLIKFESRVKPSGLLIINKCIIEQNISRDDIEIVEISASTTAKNLGNDKVANMLMLGAFIKKTGIVSLKTTKSALKECLPLHKHSLLKINEMALQKGAQLV